MSFTRLGFALGLALVASSSAANAATWDAVADFSLATNPNGAWSYRFFAGQPGVRNPANYQLFTNIGGASNWSPATNYWVNPGTPTAIGANQTGAPITGTFGPMPMVVWPANTLFMHPGGTGPSNNQLAIVAWTSPLAGAVNVSYFFQDIDANGGNGIDWFIDLNASNLLGGTLESIANPPSASASGNFNLNVAVGDTLYFIVAPRNNNQFFDSTAAQFVITALDGGAGVPEPSTVALAAVVVLAAGVGARRRAARRRG